jgi:hypothetical protein
VRDSRDLAAAVKRVQTEGPVPLHDLTTLAGASVTTIQRWIISGRHGVRLDGLRHRDGSGWLSSSQAVVRFLAEVARTEEWLEEAAGSGNASTPARAVA